VVREGCGGGAAAFGASLSTRNGGLGRPIEAGSTDSHQQTNSNVNINLQIRGIFITTVVMDYVHIPRLLNDTFVFDFIFHTGFL
jgi:hypothetical protein